MTTIDIAVTKRFIAELELAETPPAAAELPYVPIALTTEKSASVADGSVVCFTDGLSVQHKQDVLNSTLLAQLAANKKYDREKQTKEWYAYYRSVLEQVGWVVSEWHFTRYQAAAAAFQVDTVVLQILTAIATGNEIALAIAVMEALKQNSESRASKLFDQQSHTASDGSFQISCASGDGENVSMALGAFSFSTTTKVTKIFWTEFNSSQTDMYKGGQNVVLNEQVYSAVREDVIKKLGDKAKELVAGIEI